jgi:hypothetical protein
VRRGLLAGAFVATVASTQPSIAAPPPDAAASHLLRQVCDLHWVDGVCEATGFPDPQYLTGTDPSPDGRLALRVGAVHEHSSYSDGDPTAIPADYFAAARTGHNGRGGGDDDSGVRLDFLMSSEHSDNAQLPITTSADCIDPSGIPDGTLPPLACSHVLDDDHHEKWAATLRQAVEASDESFAAMRGFEWTNDVYNHMNVYLSTNVVNVKVGTGYVTMDAMWDWLRRPVAQGGGADALVTFNHPGRPPSLTPFDSGLPHSALLAAAGGENWNDVEYVPDVDERVAGMEVNGGDDLSWFVRALANGWHIGPVAAEDEHGRNWASSDQPKTLLLTRGTSARDYYFALQHHRSVAVLDDLVGGAAGEHASFPQILYWADGADIHDPASTLLGSTATGGPTHVLRAGLTGLPAGSPVALVSNTGAPLVVGTAGADGALAVEHEVRSPASGEDWWFLVVCRPTSTACGADEDYVAVTAPIWIAAD